MDDRAIEFKKSLDIAEPYAVAESKGGRPPWIYYGSSLRDYEESYAGLHVPPYFNGDVKEFLTQRRKPGEKITALDLMADAAVVRELRDEGYIDQGLAVSLGDGRSQERRSSDAVKGVHQLSGNLLERRTWQSIQSQAQQNGMKQQFDIVLSCSAGGYRTFPEEPYVYFSLLNRIWQLTSPENGLIIVQLPDKFGGVLLPFVTKAGLDTYVSELKLNETPSAYHLGELSYIAFVKTPKSPSNIPIPHQYLS